MKLFLLALFITPSFAYLDPGTGSMLVYFLLGIFATLLYSIKGFFYKLKSLLTGTKANKDLREVPEEILFYSEGGHYWNVFLPIVKEFEKMSIKTAYYTSKEDDPALMADFEHLRAEFIGGGLEAFVILNHLSAKVVVMTTPQLDILQLKRSKNVKAYVHLVHAPTDALYYKKFAFDYFDYVMCSGEHQIKSIRALEEKRKHPQKTLLKTGLTYYDEMILAQSKQAKADEKTILIAPTWGKNSMLVKFGIKPIEDLLSKGYKVILRPHPQMYVSQKKLIEDIEEKLSKYDGLEINKDLSPSGVIARSSLLISDISGIIFDFVFIGEKPIIVVNEKIERGGFEAEDVDFDVWEDAVLKDIARLIDSSNVDLLGKIVQELIDKPLQNIEDLKERSLFNFGTAGEVAAKQIMEIVNKC